MYYAVDSTRGNKIILYVTSNDKRYEQNHDESKSDNIYFSTR